MSTLKLDKNKKYLLACSYGPDSMALFHLLLLESYRFEVAIVNYHLRKESDDEVNGLINFCNAKNIKLHILDVQENITKNIEEKCREIRYDFFSRTCKENKLDGVVVAHHLDDLLETYLIQKSRQNLPIFYGLHQKTTIFNVTVYRPLLNFTKSDLLKICNENNVPFMIDQSNLENTYLRNKIRHGVVEKMSIDEKLKMLTTINTENKKLKTLFASIDRSKINSVPYLLSFKGKSFNYCLNLFINKNKVFINVGDKQCKEIRKVLLSKKPNIVFELNKTTKLIKEYDKLSVLNDNKHGYSFLIEKPTILDTEFFYINLKSFNKIKISNDQYPILIRNLRESDQYKIKDYIVSARRLLIDWKVPISLRKVWPVIVNNNNKIIYIPRYQKDFIPKDSDCFYVKTK